MSTGHPTSTASAPRPRGRSGRWVLVGVLAVLVIACVLIAIPALRYRKAPYVPVLDDFGPVPAFAFTDETGRPYGDRALTGKVSVVNFIFTRCDTICPDSTARMLEVQERTVDLDLGVQLVSFTVDPTFDTPPVLAAYAKNFHADPRRWRFVTGDLAEMRTLIEGAFMTGMEPRGTTPQGNPDIWHGQKFLLVDKAGRIRQQYDTTPVGLDRLIRDARYLARH
jgi:protein SCO1/2